MKRIIFVAFLLAGLGMPAWADYQAGLDAYRQGDDATALREWMALAEQGNAASQFMVGFMYEKGRSVPQDYATAVTWYRKAALQGYAKSQYTLGKMYEFGLGVAKDHASAFSWIKKAAEAGHVKAQYNMGKYLRDGLGVSKDPAEGIRWWTKAAEQGYVKAQGALGFLCTRRGETCPRTTPRRRRGTERPPCREMLKPNSGSD